MAVHVFFVLSGDALSVGYVATGRRAVIDRLVAKRYFRLTIPIAMVSFIAYALMKAGLTFNLLAAPLVQRDDWLGTFLHFDPTLRGLVRFSLFDVYAYPWGRSYNAFMWTMPIELLGSILVFLFLYVSPALRRPTVVASILGVALYVFNSWFALFFAGIVMARLRQAGVFERLRASYVAQVVCVAIFGASVLAVDVVSRVRADSPLALYFNEGIAIVLVGAIYSSNIALRAFRSRPSRWLGQISFPLYLVQFCVIVSLTSYLIVRWSLTRSHVAAIVLVSLGTCLAAAAVLERLEKRLLDVLDDVVRRGLRDAS